LSAGGGGDPARLWLACAALCVALAVAAGAFGAHGLAGRLDARGLELWETAARYLAYGGFSLGLVALAAARAPGERWIAIAGALALAGALVFSTTVAALALGGPGWLGAVTPLGGAALILGLALLGLRVWPRAPRR
jgi:uncharacterized membrane protein YgdD (TMEM256/DUF423 family)